MKRLRNAATKVTHSSKIYYETQFDVCVAVHHFSTTM